MPDAVTGLDLVRILDEVGRHPGFAKLHDVRRIRRVVAPDYERQIRGRLNERLGRVLILVRRVAQGNRRNGKMPIDLVLAVSRRQRIPNLLRYFVSLSGQHGRLVDDPNSSEIDIRVKPF